jgi:hypothetical protein
MKALLSFITSDNALQTLNLSLLAFNSFSYHYSMFNPRVYILTGRNYCANFHVFNFFLSLLSWKHLHFLKTGSCYAAQVSIELLGLDNSPASTSQESLTRGTCHIHDFPYFLSWCKFTNKNIERPQKKVSVVPENLREMKNVNVICTNFTLFKWVSNIFSI